MTRYRINSKECASKKTPTILNMLKFNKLKTYPLWEAPTRKMQPNFGHCPRGGGQTESKSFEELFEDLFSALVWTFFNAGGEPIPKRLKELFQLKFGHL